MFSVRYRAHDMALVQCSQAQESDGFHKGPDVASLVTPAWPSCIGQLPGSSGGSPSSQKARQLQCDVFQFFDIFLSSQSGEAGLNLRFLGPTRPSTARPPPITLIRALPCHTLANLRITVHVFA